MDKVILKLINSLILINEKMGNKSLSKSDIKDMKEYYEEFVENAQNLDGLLDLVSSTDLKNEAKFSDIMVDLHVLTSNFSYFFEELNMNVDKLIREYKFSDEFIKKNS